MCAQTDLFNRNVLRRDKSLVFCWKVTTRPLCVCLADSCPSDCRPVRQSAFLCVVKPDCVNLTVLSSVKVICVYCWSTVGVQTSKKCMFEYGCVLCALTTFITHEIVSNSFASHIYFRIHFVFLYLCWKLFLPLSFFISHKSFFYLKCTQYWLMFCLQCNAVVYSLFELKQNTRFYYIEIVDINKRQMLGLFFSFFLQFFLSCITLFATI